MNLFIIIFSILMIILAIPIYYRISNGFSVGRLNLYSYFFYSTLVLTVIGSIILGIDITEHYLHYRITDANTSVKTLLMVSLSFLSIAVVIMMLERNSAFFKTNKALSYRLKVKEKFILQSPKSKKLFELTFIGLVLISAYVIISMLFNIGLNNVPVVNLFMGADSDTLSYLRQQVTRNYPGNVYVRNLLGLTLMPMLSYIAFVEWHRNKERLWKLLYFLTLFFTIIALTYDLQKAPILRYIFSYLLIYPFIRKNKIIIKKRYILGFATLLIVSFLLITPTTLSMLFSFDFGPINRIFKTQAFSVFAHVDVFPNVNPFLHGASFPDFITKPLLGIEQVRSARLVMQVMNPTGVANGTSGVMNGFFIGEAYANFSYFGVVLSVMLVSVEMYIIQNIFMKVNKTPISVAGYVYVVNLFVNTTQGGFVDFIYNPNLTFAIVMLTVLHLIYVGRLRRESK